MLKINMHLSVSASHALVYSCKACFQGVTVNPSRLKLELFLCGAVSYEPHARKWQPRNNEREPGDCGQWPGDSGHGRLRPHGPVLAGPQRHLHQDRAAPGLCILHQHVWACGALTFTVGVNGTNAVNNTLDSNFWHFCDFLYWTVCRFSYILSLWSVLSSRYYLCQINIIKMWMSFLNMLLQQVNSLEVTPDRSMIAAAGWLRSGLTLIFRIVIFQLKWYLLYFTISSSFFLRLPTYSHVWFKL